MTDRQRDWWVQNLRCVVQCALHVPRHSLNSVEQLKQNFNMLLNSHTVGAIKLSSYNLFSICGTMLTYSGNTLRGILIVCYSRVLYSQRVCVWGCSYQCCIMYYHPTLELGPTKTVEIHTPLLSDYYSTLPHLPPCANQLIHPFPSQSL